MIAEVRERNTHLFINNYFFKKILDNCLIYNISWEDPRVDRRLLKIHEKTKILMITSAGCNALTYLLDKPELICCVDINKKQNAVLDLKLATIAAQDYDLFWQFWGKGNHKNYQKIYQQKLRPLLREYSQIFWDKKIHCFDETRGKNYFNIGTSGFLGKIFRFLFRRVEFKGHLENIFNIQDLSLQKKMYIEHVRPALIGKMSRWLSNSAIIPLLQGVPHNQLKFLKENKISMHNFLVKALDCVFLNVEANSNYFWYLYVFGFFSKTCCPDYLKEDNFHLLVDQFSKIKIYDTSLIQFLESEKMKFSDFIFLDHQDWIEDKKYIDRLWELARMQSEDSQGSILFRSISPDLAKYNHLLNHDFNIKSIYEDVSVKNQDRVGTYEGCFIGQWGNSS